jgi:hypothetical protein
MLGAVTGVQSPRLVPFFSLALIAGTVLLLRQALKARRPEISRIWTDPGRPGVVLMRRADGKVRTLGPARVRKIVLVHSSGSYRDERTGEPGEWHSYSLTRATLRAGLTWYATQNQTLPSGAAEATGWDQPSLSETLDRLAATFPKAWLRERHVTVSSQESAE